MRVPAVAENHSPSGFAASPSPQWGGAPRHVAIIDVGKTNTKVSLVAAADALVLAFRSHANASIADSPYPHLDAPGIWEFLCDALAGLHHEAAIDAIAITAHGSAGAFIRADREDDGLTMPILDYEHPGPDEFTSEYDAARPPFSETLSPRLPAGLNLGAQFFWQERRFPNEFAAATAYVNYPQYWAWRLSGVAATEMCSMGAHSDMWDPRNLRWSSMTEALGWTMKLAPLRPAFDRLGPIRPALAARLGLNPAVAVHCGIHDSSASLLPHLKERTPPFAVVSTGTWVILFGVGGDVDNLDPTRDTLANVSAFGAPVPCGRFMGGREFERLVGSMPETPNNTELARVLGERIMALPTFVTGCGPFPSRSGGWSHDPAALAPGERTAAASLYLALMTAESLMLVGASGPTVVEGPFARNTLFCSALSAITGRRVEPSDSGTGTMIGTLMTATGRLPARRPASQIEPLADPALASYVEDWRTQARAT
jgi:sugar (pentulose or hexulose) kinase